MGSRKHVVTIGGANGERMILLSPEEFQLGKKHTLAPQKILAGGSSVNHASRLLAAGIGVTPILPVVNDNVGGLIKETLDLSARAGGRKEDFDNIFVSGASLTTPFTTVLSVGPQRSIFNEFPDELIKIFPEHCEKNINIIKGLMDINPDHEEKPDAFLIGHIHADRGAFPGQGGGISENVIRTFSERGISIFVNYGSSQYKLGSSRWKHLLDKITCFQLDINEIREFCGDEKLVRLEDILSWFKDRCTLIITMERMGAVARQKGSEDIVLAWPYDLKAGEIIDSTGAGDAFAAGVVFSSLEEPLTSDLALCKALETGRLWGAYACTKLGGASECPTQEEVNVFRANHTLFLETETKSIDKARPMLRILDRIFF